MTFPSDDGAYIASDSNGYPTIWYQLQLTRDAAAGGCDDWFVLSRYEMEEVRKSGLLSFSGKYIWSSSVYSSNSAWYWYASNWLTSYKGSYGSVFFVRAF